MKLIMHEGAEKYAIQMQRTRDAVPFANPPLFVTFFDPQPASCRTP